MRALVLGLVVLLAGCVGAPTDDPSVDANATQPTAPTPPANATASLVEGLGERSPSRMEPFAFLANRTIGFAPEGTAIAEEKVAEKVGGTSFFTTLAQQPLVFEPFVSSPFNVPFETTADFDIDLKLVASAPAVLTVPSQSGFPAVGGWFGTPERWAFFVGATDMPSSLEANKVYPVKLRVATPQGGFFVREGEQLALNLFVNYQAADGSPPMWVVGGDAPAGFALPHSHFNLSAPRAIVLLDETGETGANPSPQSDSNPQPADFSFTVPPEAVYVVLEVSGAPKAGAVIDFDASIRTPGGDVLAIGSSPYASEVAAIGPSILATAGRELNAHVVSGSNASGGTFTLKVTAYAPELAPSP